MLRLGTILLPGVFAVVIPAAADHRQDLGRYRGLDRDQDGRISRAEWRGNDASFNRHDHDQDGFLDGDELNRRGRARRGESDRVRERANDAFYRMDRDGDGALESHEWTGSLEVFRNLDRNGDNVLHARELSRFTNLDFKTLDANNDQSISRREWPGDESLFSRLDRDRSGTLTAKEYLERGGENARERRFREWDTNNDGILQGTEWRSESRLFHVLDRDFDSQVSLDEFLNADRDLFLRDRDSNRDGLISRSEWRGSAAAFDDLDTDRDGMLNAEEYFYRGDDYEREERFRSIDMDRNGVIRGNEWHGDRNVFHQLDRDGNGYLTKDEFTTKGYFR